MSRIEIFPKFVQAISKVPPCADLAEIHAVVSRQFERVKKRYSNFDPMCEITPDEQGELVKRLVDGYMPDFQYAFCKIIDKKAKLHSLVTDDPTSRAKSVVDGALNDVLIEEVFFHISVDLTVHRCNIFLLLRELSAALVPLFRVVPRLMVRFSKKCAVCARIPETVEESLDEDWDDSQDELLDENETQLKTLLNRKELAFYNAFCPRESKAAKLDLQIRLIKRLQSRDVDMEVAGTSLGKRQDHDEDGSDGVGSDLGKRLRLQD